MPVERQRETAANALKEQKEARARCTLLTSNFYVADVA